MSANSSLPEVIIIAAFLLIVFGGKRLPQFGRNMGDAVKQLRKAFKE